MPEGPECAVYADFLSTYVGKAIKDIKFTDVWLTAKLGNDYCPPIGSKITRVLSIGKHIIVTFRENDERRSTVHIESKAGMSGKWTSVYNKANPDHHHITIEFENGEEIYFHDYRRFSSKWKIISEEKLQNFPPCIVHEQEEITLSMFTDLVKSRPRLNICSFLLEQKILSGIGNYIKSDVLFLSHIHPLWKCKELSATHIELLHKHILQVASESYKLGGCSFVDYRKPDGMQGMYKTRIYGKKQITHNGVLTTVTSKQVGGRPTFWLDDEDYYAYPE